MSNYNPLESTIVSAGQFQIEGEEFAIRVLSEATQTLRARSNAVGVSQNSFDEQRNKAIFQLNGEIASNHATDQADIPFPWMNNILVTEIEKINGLKNMIESVVEFYLENQDLTISDTSLIGTLED